MKKRILWLFLTLALTLGAILCVSAAQTKQLTVNILYGGDVSVSVYVDGKYLSEAPVYKISVNRGSAVTLVSSSDSFMFYSDENGNTFGDNGEYTFNLINDTAINAYCSNSDPNKVSVIYQNTNFTEQILSVMTYRVEDIELSFTDHIVAGADRFGYKFSSWDMSADEIIEAAKNGAGTVIVKPVYTQADDFYTIEVSGGYISSANESDGIFRANTNVTLSAIDAEQGKRFAYWTNGAGAVISDSQSTVITVYGNEKYTAHFVDEGEELILQPSVSIKTFFDPDIEKIVTYSQRFLPSEYTILSYGIIYAKDVYYDRNDMTLEAVDNVNLKMTYNGSPETNSGVWVNRVSCEAYVCLRPYIVYTDAGGATHTAYGDSVKALLFESSIETVVYNDAILTLTEAESLAELISNALGRDLAVCDSSSYEGDAYIYIAQITPYAEKYGWTVNDEKIVLYYGAFSSLDTVIAAFESALAEADGIEDITSSEFSATATSTVMTASKYAANGDTVNTLDLYLSNRASEILASKNTDISNISGTVYYISENGDDNNSGTSAEAPWKTLKKLSDIKLRSGDAVLFERGGLYRGTIVGVNGVTYGCYGSGNKPIICGSKRNYAGMWSRVEGETNIWKLNLSGLVDPGIMVFYKDRSELYRVGHDYEVITGQRVFDYRTMYTTYENAANSSTIHGYLTLNKNYEFYYGEPDLDEDTFNANVTTYTLYVYYNGDLNGDFENIEIGEDKILFDVNGKNNVTIDGLCFKHTGGHSVRGGKNRTDGLTVKNCVFAYSGGSVLQNRWVRYGNAIEIYGSGTDINVYDNWMYQIYDTAFTMQYSGTTIEEDLIWENVNVYNNVMERCYWGMELWCHPASGYTMTASNINITGNIISKIGNFWGAYQHQSATGGCAVYLGDMNIPDAELEVRPVRFENNIFDRTYIEGYVPSSDKIHNYTKMFKFHHDSTGLSSYHKFYEFKDNYFIQYSKELFALYNGDEGGNTYFNASQGEKYNTSAEKKWSDFFKLFSEEDMSGSMVCVITK